MRQRVKGIIKPRDVIYPPSQNKRDFRADWVENVDEFKQKVLSSEEYSILKDEPIYKLDIYDDNTE
ncbi:MAG: hypothetical protein ACLR6O_06795 [Eubacterium sp.]